MEVARGSCTPNIKGAVQGGTTRFSGSPVPSPRALSLRKQKLTMPPAVHVPDGAAAHHERGYSSQPGTAPPVLRLPCSPGGGGGILVRRERERPDKPHLGGHHLTFIETPPVGRGALGPTVMPHPVGPEAALCLAPVGCARLCPAGLAGFPSGGVLAAPTVEPTLKLIETTGPPMAPIGQGGRQLATPPPPLHRGSYGPADGHRL